MHPRAASRCQRRAPDGRALRPAAACGLHGLVLSDKYEELTALLAGLGQLRNLARLELDRCPGLATLHGLKEREGMPALLAHLRGAAE